MNHWATNWPAMMTRKEEVVEESLEDVVVP